MSGHPLPLRLEYELDEAGLAALEALSRRMDALDPLPPARFETEAGRRLLEALDRVGRASCEDVAFLEAEAPAAGGAGRRRLLVKFGAVLSALEAALGAFERELLENGHVSSPCVPVEPSAAATAGGSPIGGQPANRVKPEAGAAPSGDAA